MNNIGNLNFDDGYKEFTINNDPNRIIRFNPGDIAIVERFHNTENALEKLVEEFSNIPAEQEAVALSRLDEEVKKQIDYIFNQPVSDAVFGGQSPLSPVNGKVLFQRFLESVIPVIEENIKKEKQASQERVGKYVKAAQRV